MEFSPITPALTVCYFKVERSRQQSGIRITVSYHIFFCVKISKYVDSVRRKLEENSNKTQISVSIVFHQESKIKTFSLNPR